MDTREASIDDVDRMSLVLTEIIQHTGRQRASHAAFVMERYITDPTRICCIVAVDGAGNIAGFQSLKIAVVDNPYDTPSGWGIIGTHISPRFHRQGVGKLLFTATTAVARRAGIEKIDAYIGADNSSGLNYYDAMGFNTYRMPDGIVQKMCTL